MSVPSQASVRNLLLRAMSAESFARLLPHFEFVELGVKTQLVEPDVLTTHATFMETGLASVVAGSLDDDERIEAGHIGWEGMTGAHLILDADQSPNNTFIQVAGSGLRIAAAPLVQAVDSDIELRKLLLRYVHFQEIQLSHSTLANGRYSMRERLSRWLLMCHDRIESDDLPLTHEFLGLMLGVRRSGVTDEIHILEGLKLIKARRGNIRLLDRARMEEVASGCYGLPEREYERLIGVDPRVS